MDNLSLDQFDPNVEALQQLVTLTKDVTITDFADKEQLEEVKKNRILLRDARVAITKKGKELREGAVKFQKDVITKERELVAIIEPEEERLKLLEDEAKVKKVRAERIALLPERKKRLTEIQDGNDYSQDDELLIGMDNVEFEAYFNDRVTKKNEKAAADIKAREDAAQAEEKRLADEKTAREREEKARQEEREKAEREAKEKAEREEKERKEREAREAEQKLKARREKLIRAGLMFDVATSAFVYEGIKVTIPEVETMGDEEFGAMLVKHEAEIKSHKEAVAKKIEEARLAKEKRYQDFLKEHGYTEETKATFYLERNEKNGTVILYKAVGVFKLND